MAGETASSVLDLMLRGGACVLLVLLAALLLRDNARVRAARLGALFALGAATHALESSGLIRGWIGQPHVLLLAVSTANNVVFWLFARALFDDGFRPARWHAALWAAVAGLVALCGLWLKPAGLPFAGPLDVALNLGSLGLAVAAVGQTLASWGADLVEQRRRIRVVLVAAAAGYIVVMALDNLARDALPAWPGLELGEAAALAAIAAGVAWAFLGVAGGEALFPVAGKAPAEPAPELSPAEAALAARVTRTMEYDRAYREDGLTIGTLAHRLGAPEYRLRRVINQGLGQRNFSAFLNGYRIAEAKAALADPGQAEVPILTIALDAGFSSLGPFNRAFRAETGLTPSAFRRRNGGAAAPGGRVISISAGRIRKSA